MQTLKDIKLRRAGEHALVAGERLGMTPQAGQREAPVRPRVEILGRLLERLVERGCDGVILGCTEIELLIGPEDSPVPVLPTTRLHAEAAVAWALA